MKWDEISTGAMHLTCKSNVVKLACIFEVHICDEKLGDHRWFLLRIGLILLARY